MTEKNQFNKTRRTFIKGAAATGVAATGITAFSGSVAAQEQDPEFSIDDGGPTEVVGGEVTEYGAVEETNRRLPNLQEIIVEVTDIDEDNETASGTVTAVSRGRGRGAQRDTTEFEDAPVELDDNGNGVVEILRLDIQDLFLNLLGLQVHLDLFLLVEAVEGEGLLGDLLVALLGS